MNKSIKTEIIINASAATVWKILTDFGRYPEWNPFILRTEGQLAPGQRLRNTLKNGNSQIVFKPVVQEVTPGRSFSWLGSLFIKGLFDGRHYFSIEEIGPGQVKLLHGEDFSGILSGIFLKQIVQETRNNFIAMNQALKQRAEQQS